MKHTFGNVGFFTKLSSLPALYSFWYCNTTELGFSVSRVHGWRIDLQGMTDLKTGCKTTGLIRRMQADIITGSESIKNYPLRDPIKQVRKIITSVESYLPKKENIKKRSAIHRQLRMPV